MMMMTATVTMGSHYYLGLGTPSGVNGNARLSGDTVMNDHICSRTNQCGEMTTMSSNFAHMDRIAEGNA